MTIEIFRNIKNSLYNPEFYSSQLQASGGKAFGYFVKLVLLETLFLTLIFTFVGGKSLVKILNKKNLEKVVAMYPADLQLTFKDGHLSTNVVEPYIVPLPADLSQSNRFSGSHNYHKNFFVIDTKNPFSVDSFPKYDTDILLTRDYLVMEKSRGGQLEVQKLSNFPDTVIDSSKINLWTKTIEPAIKYLFLFLMIIYFIGIFVVNMIGHLLLILIFSIITWVVQLIKKSGIGYGECLKLGLYAITLLVVINVVMRFAGITLAGYISWIIFLVAFFANTSTLKSNA